MNRVFEQIPEKPNWSSLFTTWKPHFLTICRCLFGFSDSHIFLLNCLAPHHCGGDALFHLEMIVPSAEKSIQNTSQHRLTTDEGLAKCNSNMFHFYLLIYSIGSPILLLDWVFNTKNPGIGWFQTSGLVISPAALTQLSEYIFALRYEYVFNTSINMTYSFTQLVPWNVNLSFHCKTVFLSAGLWCMELYI